MMIEATDVLRLRSKNAVITEGHQIECQHSNLNKERISKQHVLKRPLLHTFCVRFDSTVVE